jgi:hypothetical protein
MTLYGYDMLIAGNFSGPTTNKSNLVLLDGDTGEVIRWYNSPKLKSVLGAPDLGRIYGGGRSLSAFDFATGEKLWTEAKTEVDAIRAHDSKPAYRDLELDADGKTIWAACICDKVGGKAAKALVKLVTDGNHYASWLTQAGTGAFGQSVVDHNGKLFLAAAAATLWPSSIRRPEAPEAGSEIPQVWHRRWRSITANWWSAGTSTTLATIKPISVGPGVPEMLSLTRAQSANGGRA